MSEDTEPKVGIADALARAMYGSETVEALNAVAEAQRRRENRRAVMRENRETIVTVALPFVIAVALFVLAGIGRVLWTVSL